MKKTDSAILFRFFFFGLSCLLVSVKLFAGSRSMPTYVALLYSITLPGNRRLIMSDLRNLADGLGFLNARTVVATGNLIFETARSVTLAKLTRQLETAYNQTFGRELDIIVLSAKELNDLVASNLFPEQSRSDPSHLIVRVLRNPVTAETVDSLQRLTANGEQIKTAAGHLWIYFAKDIGHSKLAAALTPQKAGGPGTSRNWNTLLKIQDAL